MTKEVEAVEADTSVKEVAKKLVDLKITGMPVVDGETVVGIVTEDDLILKEATLHVPEYINVLSSFLYLEDPDDVEMDLKKMLAVTAGDLMTDDVVSIGPESTVEELATLFKENDINPIPVEADGRLVGIVSRADIVKLLARED